jgi:hypothetical protein
MSIEKFGDDKNLLQEAIIFMKTYFFEICDRKDIMVTYHHNLSDEHGCNCLGEFRFKNQVFEIRLLDHYNNDLDELFTFSHELGHYFAMVSIKNLSKHEEEIYANKIFLDFLSKMPEWVILCFKSFVFEYKILEEDFNCTETYMDLFGIKLENITKSYELNKKIA